MAKTLGSEYRLWVKAASGDTFNLLKGETTLKISRQRSGVPAATKDDWPNEPELPGGRKITITVECLPDLPDATGYSRMETIMAGNAPEEFQIRKGGVDGEAPADVVFHAEMNVSGNDTDTNRGETTKASWTLTLGGTVTKDQLA